MKISIQGDRGSFHEVAARQYFGSSVEILPCSTFDMTLSAVKERIADFAVMAVENSRSGSLLYNYTLIRESGLRVIGEHNLRIKQNLLSIPGQTISSIREIHSHPVAIAQCMEYLSRLKGVKFIETDDTAGSARWISENKRKGIAAIASTSAASLYNLEVLAEGIETYRHNFTRFLVCSEIQPDMDGPDKASVCFSLGHQPGSLASLLVMLAERDINLTRIQSIPKMSDSWQYLFYLDLEFSRETDTGDLFRLLKESTGDLEILGVYTKNEIIYES